MLHDLVHHNVDFSFYSFPLRLTHITSTADKLSTALIIFTAVISIQKTHTKIKRTLYRNGILPSVHTPPYWNASRNTAANIFRTHLKTYVMVAWSHSFTSLCSDRILPHSHTWTPDFLHLPQVQLFSAPERVKERIKYFQYIKYLI